MVDRAYPDFSSFAGWLVDLCQQLRARSVYLQSVLKHLEPAWGLRPIVAFAVEIKHDESDAEERLQNSLQDTHSQSCVIESVGLEGGVHLLVKRLRVLGAHQFDEIVAQHRPLRNNCDRENKREPNRDDERAAPNWALIPGKIASTASEISALTQRIGRVGVFKHGELLPEKNVDEEPAEQPNLKNKQAEREHDGEERR